MVISAQLSELQARRLSAMLGVPIADARVAMDIARHAATEGENTMARIIATCDPRMAKTVTLAAASMVIMDMHKAIKDLFGDAPARLILETCMDAEDLIERLRKYAQEASSGKL